jgi:hypothetical protein
MRGIWPDARKLMGYFIDRAGVGAAAQEAIDEGVKNGTAARNQYDATQ